MNRTRTSRLAAALVFVTAAATAPACFVSGGGSTGGEPAGTAGGATVVSSGGGGGGGAAVASGQPAVATSGPPGQWSLEEREYWTQLQTELDDYVRQMNQECGTNATAAYVHETFRGRMTAGGSYGLDGYTRSTCAAPLTALRSVCQQSPASRAAVASRITRVECGWGQTDYSLNGGTVRMMFNTDAQNAAAYETEFSTWVRRQL